MVSVKIYCLLLLSLFFVPSWLLAQLPIKTVTDVKYLGGGIADTFKGKIDGRKYALKPVSRIGNSNLVAGEFGQGNAEAELVCLPLLKRLGLLVPNAFLFRPGPEAPPILAVEWIDKQFAGSEPISGREFLAKQDLNEICTQSFARMLVADVLTKNPDRHGGNFFAHRAKDGLFHPIPIDHNLALEPNSSSGNINPISLNDFAGLSAYSGKFASLEGWGQIVLKEVSTITNTLKNEDVDEIVGTLPSTIPRARKIHIRNLLHERLNKMPQAAEMWKKQWHPIPEDFSLPGRLHYAFLFSPNEGAFLCAYLYLITQREPAAAPHVSSYLNYNFSPLPGDIAASLSKAVDQICYCLQTPREKLLDNSKKVDKLIKGLNAGIEELSKKRDVSRDEAFGIVWSAYFGALNSGIIGPAEIYRQLAALGAYEEPHFGQFTALRVAYVISCGWTNTNDENHKRKLIRMQKLLKAQWRNVLTKKDEIENGLRATKILHSSFGRFMSKLYPSIEKKHIKTAISKALANFDKKQFYVYDNKCEPRVLAFVIRMMCQSAERELSWENFWRAIVTFGDFSKNGPWLYGWEGPYTLACTDIGTDFLQYQGIAPHSASRILFERLAWGPYGDWRGLMRRNSPQDIEGLVINPQKPQIPAVITLSEAKFHGAVTAPAGSFKATKIGNELRLSVSVIGLQTISIVSIPVYEKDSGLFVGELSPVEKETLKKLGLQEASQIPYSWL